MTLIVNRFDCLLLLGVVVFAFFVCYGLMCLFVECLCCVVFGCCVLLLFGCDLFVVFVYCACLCFVSVWSVLLFFLVGTCVLYWCFGGNVCVGVVRLWVCLVVVACCCYVLVLFACSGLMCLFVVCWFVLCLFGVCCCCLLDCCLLHCCLCVVGVLCFLVFDCVSCSFVCFSFMT